MKTYSEYKDSGVQWIGKVPSHWNPCRFKNFISLINTPSKDDNKIGLENIESGTGHFKETDSEFEGNGVQFVEDDIIYGKLRPYLRKVWLATNKGNAVGDFFVFRANKSKPSYIHWLMLSDGFTSEANGSTYGAKMPRVSSDFILSMRYVLPPFPEQQAIASFLDAKTKPIDDIIAKREKQIELLEEMKSAIISHAVTKGLNPDAKMKDSGIEWIKTEPQSWETRRIKNVITLLTDYDANGSFADIAKNVKVNVGEPYAWMVRATDLANKRYGIVDDNNYCNKETFDFLSKSSLEAGDILIAKRGDIGKSYEVPKCDCPMTLAPNTYLLKTNKQVISNRFFHYFFMSDYGKKQLSINNKSTTIGAIYKDDVKNLKILLPPMDEQQAIASYLDTETSKIDSRIAKRRKQIELLQEYKQALITAAVTGKIDVREYNS